MAIINSGRVGAGTASDPLRRKRVQARSGDRFVVAGVEPPQPEVVAEPPGVTAPCLLAMQETAADAGALDARAQALRRGTDLLDRLDGLRLDLARGRVPPDRLADLVGALEAERAASADPRLDTLLAEIELRALVEVAKLRHGRP